MTQGLIGMSAIAVDAASQCWSDERMMVYFKLMLLKCSLMMVKCSLMIVKGSSMMVDEYMNLHSFHHH